jgi:hypothetical protein
MKTAVPPRIGPETGQPTSAPSGSGVTVVKTPPPNRGANRLPPNDRTSDFQPGRQTPNAALLSGDSANAPHVRSAQSLYAEVNPKVRGDNRYEIELGNQLAMSSDPNVRKAWEELSALGEVQVRIYIEGLPLSDSQKTITVWSGGEAVTFMDKSATPERFSELLSGWNTSAEAILLQAAKTVTTPGALIKTSNNPEVVLLRDPTSGELKGVVYDHSREEYVLAPPADSKG